MVRLLLLSFLVWVVAPAPSFSGSHGPILNEISAMGTRTYLDEDGDQHDWIEIENPSDQPISLLGWSLSDTPSNPRKWVFPDVALPANGFLVVFASQKDRAPTSDPLHTNFGLGSEGEFLGLYDADSGLVDAFDPGFPLQREGYSYGVHPQTGGNVFFATPTPGAENEPAGSFSEFLNLEVLFDPPRGIYENQGPLDINLFVDDPEAVIRYTTDYSTPGPDNGQLASGPIPISTNSTVRAVALKEGFGPSWVETHTYLLTLTAQQKSLPIMVVTTDAKNLDGPEGIRHPNNVQERGRRWERPVSMEYFDLESGAAHHTGSGLRLHGQLGRTSLAKKTFRLYFRDEYGDPELTFLPMPDSEVQSFKRIVLRGGVQDSNPFVHDELARRTFGKMGQVTSHGTFFQFFLNGVYWSQYNPTERYDAYFFDSWHGGGLEWDIVRHSGLAEGDLVEWNKLMNLVQSADLSNNSLYREATLLLDVVNFADYLLLNAFAGTEDWPANNWTAARPRTPGSRFRFYVWDAEQSFARANSAFHNTFVEQLDVVDAPIAQIYRALSASPDFRRTMAARFRKHFYEGGALTDHAVLKRYLDLRYTIRDALPGMVNRISFLWIPRRRYNLEKHLDDKGFLDFIDLPSFGSAPPHPLPLLDTAPASGSPDLAPDSFIDVQDILEFKRQAVAPSNQVDFVRLGFRDMDWERYDYSVALGDLSLVAEDFDGDGSLDLACVNNDFGTLSVFLNNGSGRFERPRESPGPIGAEALGVADLDRDGLPDLVVASRVLLQQSISSHLNNGDGTFSTFETIPTNRTQETKYIFARALVLKDLDGDGDPDLVVNHESSIKNRVGRGAPQNAVTVYSNTGDGSLLHSATLFGGSAELMSRQCLLVEDFDGDSDLDLVGLDGDNGLIFMENQGGLQFAQPRSVGRGGLQRYNSLVALDLNGDGALDILASSLGNPNVTAFMNDGQGNFVLDNAYRVNGNLPESLFAADLNSDSHPDLLITNLDPILLTPKGHFDVMLNDGSGRFTRSSRLTPPGYDPMPKSVVSGDFDGDGDADFAALDHYNGVLSVFLNQQTPSKPSADINSDNRIDFLDLLEIQPLWGSEVSGP